MSEDTNTGTAAAVAEITERLARHEEVDLGPTGSDLLIIPNGKQVIDLLQFEDKRLEHPRRRRGQSHHTTLDSFVDHVVRTKDDGTAVFANDDTKASCLLAVYDYNEPTEVADYSVDPTTRRSGLPRFGEHRAFYSMPFSDEWLAWQRIAGEGAAWLSQLDFAQALEDRGLDVLAPGDIPEATAKVAASLGIAAAGPTALMNLARGLTVRADRKVGSAVNLNTGEARITFEEAHEASAQGAPVVVPTGFCVSVPVFRDGDAYALLVRLRYKLEGAAVKWRLSAHRSDAAFRDAFNDVSTSVRHRTACPVFYGTPEK